MPALNDVLGFGSLFQQGNTLTYQTSTVWTNVFSELIDIEPPDPKLQAIIKKTFSSPGMVIQKKAGWTDNGTATIKSNYDSDEFVTVQGWGNITQSFRIVYNDGESSTSGSSSVTGHSYYSGVMFNAFIVGKPQKVNLDGFVTTEIKLEIDGVIQWTQGILI